MQIDQNVIEEILTRADIVDIIGREVKLKRSGHNYMGLCPFHNEKSPSFSINVPKQYFHCFGCGETGDVISFVMKSQAIDFIDAVKTLAAEYSVHIPETTKFTKQEIKLQKELKLNLSETIKKATTYYRANLTKSNLAVGYLNKRGLSAEIQNKFLLGYTSDSSSPLKQVFSDYTHNQHLIDAGLVIKSDNGNTYDRFRNRIIFPIRNTRGEIIAFGGRIIDQGEPKYLNSPETILFSKSHELYGLFEAQKAIRDKNHVIVVEGYMDVIALAQFGIDNVVATMGTAATEEHIKKLFRLCDNIYYCFDGDKAGQKAAWRALERSVANVTDLKGASFVFLPEEHDPDSFIRKFGTTGFEQQVQHGSLPLSTFLIEQLTKDVNIRSDEGKARLISLAKPYIEQTHAVGLQVMLKGQLAKAVNLPPSVVESILNNRSRYAFYNSYTRFNQNHPSATTKLSSATLTQIELTINTALKHIDWISHYNLPEQLDKFSPAIQDLILLLDYISNNYDINEPIGIDMLKDKVTLSTLDIAKIANKTLVIDITVAEFYQYLDHLFGITHNKVIKIPKIPLKKQPHE